MLCWYNLQFWYLWSQFVIVMGMVIVNKQHSVLIMQYMISRTYIPHHLIGNEHTTTSLSKLYACPSYIRYPSYYYFGIRKLYLKCHQVFHSIEQAPFSACRIEPWCIVNQGAKRGIFDQEVLPRLKMTIGYTIEFKTYKFWIKDIREDKGITKF